MPVDPARQNSNTKGLRAAFRYLLTDAIRDFNAAVSLGRNLRKGKISRAEFSAAMDRRFPPPDLTR